MTSKDLNLSLEQRPDKAAPGGPGPPRGRSPQDRLPQERLPQDRLPQERLPQEQLARMRPAAAANSGPAAASGPAASRPWIFLPGVVLAVVLGNGLVLAAAVYWLYLQPAGDLVAGAPAPAAMAPALARALELLDAKVGALDSKVAQLQQMLGEQRAITTSALLDLQEQLAAAGSPAAGSPAAGGPQPVADRWLINAGTFASVGPAERLLRQLVTLGYEARLGALATAGQQQHRVQVTGFADRAAAEEAARIIVRETDLNGLWVWKED